MSSITSKKALASLFALSGCISAIAADVATPFSQAAYDSVAKDKAVVLVSANLARRWKCGAFENAQLQSLGFDRIGSEKATSDKADILIEDGSWLSAKQGFTNVALIVEPGEYQFSSYKIKVAKSISQVGYYSGDRSTLMVDGKSKAGGFSVGTGEVIYIGHFALDCASAPMPWRYYPEDKAAFLKYLEAVAREYPGLPTQQAKFRLFETTLMGNPFRLPE